MADVRRSRGEDYIFRDGGYRRVTPEEAEIMNGDTTGVAIKSIIADLTALGDIALAAGSAMLPGAVQGTSRFDVASVAQAGIDEHLGAAGEQAAYSQQVAELNPEAASLAGGIYNLFDVATMGVGSAPRRAGREAASTLAERVAARTEVGQEVRAAQRTAPGVFGEATVYQQSTVGAQQVGKVGTVGKLYRAVTERLGRPPKFSSDQFEVLESRLYAEVGFEFPPGSLDDPGLFASYKSNPFANHIIQPILDDNAAKLGGKMIRALKLDPADFPRGLGRGVRARARREQGAAFNQVGKDITGGTDLTEIAEDALPFVRRGSKRLLKDSPENISGPELMSIRSQLNKSLDVAWRNDSESAFLIEDMIEAVDEVILDALGPEKTSAWLDLRENWRVFKGFDRRGVIDPKTGDLSLKSLTLALEKQFRDFADASPMDLDTIPLRLESTRELLKFVRVARSFADSIADSGTATRSTLQALTGAKAMVKMKSLAMALKNGARGPEEALDAAR